VSAAAAVAAGMNAVVAAVVVESADRSLLQARRTVSASFFMECVYPKNRKAAIDRRSKIAAFSVFLATHWGLARSWKLVANSYQIPLSLPVNLKATAAAEASGGSRLSRSVAGTSPRTMVSVSWRV
jgi:hypothetical protein